MPGEPLNSAAYVILTQTTLQMADNVSPERRSEIMSAVKSANTKPELLVRKHLFQNGFRFRINDKSLPGKPDVKLTKYKTVVLVNGCFWHGHEGCRIYVMPKTNPEFWQAKIDRNMERDRKNINLLERAGWRVLIVWECQLKKSRRDETLGKLVEKIHSF